MTAASSNNGQRKMKRRALPFSSTLCPNAPVMGCNDLLAKSETQPCASDALAFGDYPAVKWLKDSL